jgi:eukaryotic-like serine/threonine-protein kinase
VSAGLAGENRLVTVMFADMSGSVSSTSSLDAEEAALLVNQLLEEMVAAIAEYGGRVDRFLGDGVLAVFGAVSVHEDDAERAIRTAVRIREQARKLGVATTAGVNTGEAYFGTVGSALHQEVTVMGPAVNLAARLQGQADPGEVLVGEVTWRQTRGMFEGEPIVFDIKGINDPVVAYRVLGTTARPEKRRDLEGFQGPLVGRDEQLRVLVTDLAAAASGQGRLVLVTGEAGIGKTRLLAELRARSTLVHPVPRWLEGHCREMTMSVSYGPFVEAVGSLVGVSAGDDAATASERVATALRSLTNGNYLSAERAAELRPLLGWLLAADLSTAPEGAPLLSGPEQLKREVFNGVRDFLVAAGRRQPLTVFLDDLHWSDQLSVELVKFLLEGLADARLLMVCSFRLEPERPCATLVTDTAAYPGRVRHLSLGDLTPLEVERLLGDLVGLRPLPSTLTAWIVPRTRGIPFYVEELLRALIDRGVMRIEDGIWILDRPANQTPVPESIQSLIRARLDLVSSEARTVISDAAVLGLVFRTDVLVALRGESPPVLAALEELEARALVQRNASEADWSFKHALIQETAYKSLLRPVRAARHAKAGRALEELATRQRDEPVEEIARHYDLGEVADKAAWWLLRAGRRARRAFLNDQAVLDFRRGIEWLMHVPGDVLAEATRNQMALELHEELGATLDVMAHHTKARDAYEAALASASDAALVTRARLLRKIGITLGSEDRFDEAMRCYAQAKRLLDEEALRDQPWWSEWLDVQMEQMWIHYQADRWEDMADLATRLQPAVEHHGAAAQRVGFFRCLGAMVLRRDRYVVDDEEAIGYARKAFAAAETSEDMVLLGHACFMLGFILLWHGDSVDAEENMRRALSIWERTGDVAGKAACQVYLTLIARRAGDVELVRQQATRALESATLANAVQYVGAAKANLAWVALREGQRGEAEQLGRQALDCWAPLANAYGLRWQAIWPLLWLALERDDLAEAKALADQLLAHSQQLPPTDLRPLLERIVHDSTDEVQARHLLREAAATAKTIGYL